MLFRSVAQNLLITRAIDKSNIKPLKTLGDLSALTPGVLGTNGITTFDIISGVTAKTQPDILIAIDALCASSIRRVGCCFQLSNAGISPGAGVANAQKTLNETTLGLPVIALGVPLMIHAHALCADGLVPEASGLVVTPKDIDFYIKICTHIVSNAINLAVHGEEYFNFL